MTVRSRGVTKRLRTQQLKWQQWAADRERKLPYPEKLRILDRLMAEGAAVLAHKRQRTTKPRSVSEP